MPLPQLIDFSPCLRGQLTSNATTGSGTAPGCMEIGRPSQELGPKGPRKGAKRVEEAGQLVPVRAIILRRAEHDHIFGAWCRELILVWGDV